MSARDRLAETLRNPGLVGLDEEETAGLLDAFAHELVDRARRGFDLLEESVGAHQCAKEAREILDMVDPATLDPDGWEF